MKRLKKFIIVLLIVIVILGSCVGFAINSMLKTAREEEKKLVNMAINLTQIQDGEYDGHSQTSFVTVDVKVMVQNGMIKDIELVKHECGTGQSANVIIEDMIKENTYDVDTISGATMSSKVIINAVNDALQKGL